MIAQQLPGRTDNDVKNYWNTKLKKKLCEMGIDHVTHKPFSQIIADYGSIGAFPTPTTQIRDFNNTFIHKTEQQSPLQISNFNTTNRSPESFFSNNYTNDTTQSLDLLTQLQAITLVAQAPNHDIINQPQFCINEHSSSSSSSPSSIANEEGWLPTSFSWRDFLLEDAIPPQNGVLKQENLEEEKEVSLKHSSSQVGVDIKLQNDMNKEVNDIPMISCFKGSTDSSSFVEAMLEGEEDMFLEFPGLLEEPFLY